MAFAQFFINVEDRVPARRIAVLELGAIVNAAQSGTVINVHPTHELGSNDKILFASNRRNISVEKVWTVGGLGVDGDTVTLNNGGALDWPDLSFMVNLGADTGGTQNADGSFNLPNWDAGAITVYKDPDGTATWANGIVDASPGGEAEFWCDRREVWAVPLGDDDKPSRLYRLKAGAGAISVSALPTASERLLGEVRILDSGTGETQAYICMRAADEAYEWVQFSSGGV